MNSLNARPLNDLRRQLRAGVHPRILTDKWEHGSEREAYVIGFFVVKRESRYPSPFYPKLGLRRAPTVRVETKTGVYEIQRYYEPIRGNESVKRSPEWKRIVSVPYMDLHATNVVTDKHGRLVAFDW